MNTRNTRLYDKSAALFGLNHAADAIAETGEAVLVEGYTDAIACHVASTQAAQSAERIAAEHGTFSRTTRLPEGTDPAELEPDDLRRAIRTTLPSPWAAVHNLTRANSQWQQTQETRETLKLAGQTDPVAVIVTATEIAEPTGHDIQTLIDAASYTVPDTPSTLAPPAREADLSI